MTTLAEQWKAEGRVEGAQRVLLQILEAKFADLPATARQRVEAATEAQVLRWTTRVLSANSLAELLVD